MLRLARRNWLCTAALLLLAATARGQDGPQSVTISLRDRAVVGRRCVRLADIADLRGGPEALRRQLGDLDIDDVPAGETQPHTCSRTQIQYRLRLAGIPAQLFAFAGAREVLLVADRRPLSTERIVEAAHEELLRRLPWPTDQMSVKLAQAITVPLPNVAD